MIDGYDVNVSDTGWADLGMAGSNFSDERYTITNPGDGYVFVSGKDGSTNGGSLVLATDNSGTSNDIVFATGGFTYDKERMRFNHADNKFYIGNQDHTADLEVAGTSYLKTTNVDGEFILDNNAPIYWYGPGSNASMRYDSDVSTFKLETVGGINLKTNWNKTWNFDGTGVLHLPAGGDIKNSAGDSVLSAAYTLPTASSDTLGGVKVDGSTIVITDGVISTTGAGFSYTLPTASTDTLGGVKIDGTTISITDGVISAVIPTDITAFNNNAGYLTSVTTITGNAGTATKLATARNINGVAFDGTGDITVTAAAGTLTGNTLNAGITGSSLTSVGTLTNLTVTNTIAGSVTGSAGSVAGTNLTGTTLASGITSSSLTSVGTLTDLTVTNTITGSVSGSAGSSPANALTGTTLNSTVVTSSLTSVGTLNSLIVAGALVRNGNMSQAAWGANGVGLRLMNATYTDTSSSGTLGTSTVHYIGQPTLAFSTATSVSQANTLYISGAPTAGTNATISQALALNVASGVTSFGGAVRFNGALQSGGGASIMTFSNSAATVNADLTIVGQTYQANRISFRVYGTDASHFTTTTNTNGQLSGSNFTIDYQQGGTALSSSTGVFTAPYAGVYSITLAARCYSNTGAMSAFAVKKTSGGVTKTACYLEWAANTTVNHIGTATTMKLAANDTLALVVTAGDITFDSNDSWTVTFLG